MKEAISGTILAVFISIFSFAPLEIEKPIFHNNLAKTKTTEELIKKTDLYNRVSKMEVKIDSFELKISRLENAEKINKNARR